MNKEYFYRDDAIFIHTDKGLKNVPYHHNIDEILKLENNIENIEQVLIKEENKLKRYLTTKEQKRQTKITNYKFFIALIITWLAPQAAIALISGLKASALIYPFLRVYLSPLVTVYLSIFYAHHHLQTKKAETKYQAVKAKITYLKEKLQENKKKLKVAQEKNTPILNNQETFTNLNPYNKKYLLTLYKKLYLIQKFQLKCEKYLRYYEKGTLNQKLIKENISPEDTKILTEIIAEKGLSRNKKIT